MEGLANELIEESKIMPVLRLHVYSVRNLGSSQAHRRREPFSHKGTPGAACWVDCALDEHEFRSRHDSRLISAFAHPLRREIVERLSGGPATVGEVTRDFGVSKPTISRHLRMLEQAGVVSRVIVWRNHRLTLRSETPAGAEEWIENQRTR